MRYINPSSGVCCLGVLNHNEDKVLLCKQGKGDTIRIGNLRIPQAHNPSKQMRRKNLLAATMISCLKERILRNSRSFCMHNVNA